MKNSNEITFKDWVLKIIDSYLFKIVREDIVAISSTAEPVTAVAMAILNNFIEEWNNLKFMLLIEGLSTGLNVETRLHKLREYVISSPEKAWLVASIFRKTINSECPKVCVIYGIVLAEKSDEDKTFSHDEFIVCKALENATDYDLENFAKIMKEYNMKEENNRIVFPDELDCFDSYINTCEWAVYNRIFTSHIYEWGPLEDEIKSFIKTPYYATNVADILMKYIDLAKPVWSYL